MRGANGKYQVNPGKFSEIMDGDVGKPAEDADAVTHSWWWEEFDNMRAEMVRSKYGYLEHLDSLVAQ